MTCETLKMTNRSCWADLQYIGLITAGVPARNKQMLHGGKWTEQVGWRPYCGQVELSVTMGGLRTVETPPSAKKLFKKAVMPILSKTLPGGVGKFSGKLMLHYNEGNLTRLDLAT